MGSVVSEITMGKLSPTQPLLSASPLSRATYACPNHRVSASHSTISHLSMKVQIWEKVGWEISSGEFQLKKMWNQESKYCILFKTILERLLKVAADEWNVKEKNCTKSIPCWIVRKGDFWKDLWNGAKIVENKIWGNTGDKAAGHKLVSPGKILLFGICRDIAAVKIKCRFKKRSSSC